MLKLSKIKTQQTSWFPDPDRDTVKQTIKQNINFKKLKALKYWMKNTLLT